MLGEFFSSVPGKKVLGNKKNQAVLLNVWASVYWFVWDLFDILLSGLDFEVTPKHFLSKGEVIYLFHVSGILSLLPQETDWSLFCLAWLSSPLSHLPTGHKISALSRQVTQHGAICSNVMMYHRLTADKKLPYYEFMLLQYVQFVYPKGTFRSLLIETSCSF